MARARNTGSKTSSAKTSAKGGSSSRSKSSAKKATKTLKDGTRGCKTSKRAAASATLVQSKRGKKRSTVSSHIMKKSASTVTPVPVPEVVVPKELRSAARRIAKVAEGLKPGELVTPTAAGFGDVALPAATLSIISEVIEKLASGKATTLLVADDNGDLTAQQAADLLGVSRPHLNQLLEAEGIPHRRLTDSPGSHRRIPADAVLALKAQHEDSQRNMDELMQLSAELAE